VKHKLHSHIRLRWNTLLSTLLPVLLLTLAACAQTAPDARSVVSLPEKFTTSGSAELPAQWWQSFADPDLNSLIDRSLTGNLDLKSTWDRLRQAEAIQRKAGAGLFPTLDAEAAAGSIRSHQNNLTTNSRDFSLGLVARYEIDLWGRVRSDREATVFTTRASAADLQAAAMTLSAQVAGTWYQLVEKQGQLALLDRQITTNRKVLELITLRFRTGQAAIADVLQQRQLVETNTGERARVAGEATVLQNRLSVLTGTAPGQLPLPYRAELINLPPLPTTGIPAEQIKNRPDIRSAWYKVLAADQRTAVAVADRFPRLSISARATTGGDHTDELFDNWLATLAGNLVAPLIDGGQRRAEVDRTRAVTSENLHNYGQTVLEALGEVENALAQEQHQQEYLRSLEKQLELAQNVIDSIRDRYLNGAETYQRVLDALLSYQRLQQNYLSGQRTLIQYRIDLCRALGGGWELAPSDETADSQRVSDAT
jgi:NodT family efflux transporter outer membrane factor (OMF) lipoprotein